MTVELSAVIARAHAGRLGDNVMGMERWDPSKREKVLVGVYALSGLLTCVLVDIAPKSLAYRLIKVCPLLALMVARFLEPRDRLALWIGFGLVASFLGDVAIDSNFVAGLASFLIAHLFYITAMGRPRQTIGTVWLYLPALALAVSMISILVGSGRAPTPLHIPVTTYICVISTMLGRALARAFAEVQDRASRILLAGACFFVVSDSLIGINRWVWPIPHAGVLIMATYYAGQWGIYWGSRRQTQP